MNLPVVTERAVQLLRCAAPLLLLLAAGTVRAELPQLDGRVHEGVATCASGVCHGAATERNSTAVLQNEFTTWTRYDAHARAYAVLLNDDSKRIARNLGLPNAHEAGICLDCHADNVPTELRGAEFRIEDGVGCEACHGGAENWLESHKADAATHADNLANGLHPTEIVEERAELCLSCHLGTEDKFATHEIMGAGHPRLSFELSTFEALQPPHWAYDAEYMERKLEVDDFRTWAGGLLTAARKNIGLLTGPLVHGDGLFPEVALFDCHSCHHPMSDIRWASTTATAGLKPGAIRINDANLVILLPLAEALDPALHTRMLGQIRALNRSVAGGRDALMAAATSLDESVNVLEGLVRRGVDAGARRAILDGLLTRAVRGDYRDYIAAEQAAMAMDLLLISLDRWEANKPRIDAVFDTVQDDEAYRPGRFVAAADALRKAL
ncbi:MAG: multiheme c-type cytochrome [Pseudomonadales bacterium]|jgi:hypothetical protein|nr:multiheme c-type cytochrome [Pseudomonadales bacterium]